MSTSRATRISTEAASRRQRLGLRRFHRGFWATAIVLALACAGLGAASVLQGPRIQGGQVDAAAAVAGPVTLRLVIDEGIAELDPDQVRVEPEAPFSVQTDGSVVLLAFERALDYATDYRVALAGVTAASGGVAADLSYEFATPAFTPTWLERSASGDRILRGEPGAAPETVYTGLRIQDYVDLGQAALVVRLDGAGTSLADIVATDGSGNVESLLLPGGLPGRIELLTPSGVNVLYTYTSLDPEASEAAGVPVFDDTLMRLDLGGTHISEPVLGLDGQPVTADTILPIPGTTAFLVHSRAGDVLRYDPASGEPPTLVAAYPELVSLASDGHRAVVKDALGHVVYDLADGSETRFEPSPVEGGTAIPFVADVVALSGDRAIERAVLPNEDFTAFDSFVAVDDGTSARLLFRTAEPTGSVIGYRVTPNERYLVAEVSPGGDSLEASDGYEADARPRDVRIVLIDLTTGEVAGEWPGSHARW